MRIPLFFLLLVNLSFSQKVNFETTVDDAFRKAKKENKLVFIEYYNEECTICKSIEPLFSNKEMADFYNKNFVSYKINTKGGLQGKDSLFMAETKIKFQGVPYFMFFDQNKNFIHYSGAKSDLDYLLNIGKTALNPEQRTGSLQAKYDAGDRTIKTLYAYTDVAQLYQDDELSNTISNQLFEVYPKQNLGTRQSYLILKNSVFSIDNGFFIYWYQNRSNLKDFEKGSKSGEEIKVLERIVLESIQKQKSNWDLIQIEKVKEYTIGLGLSKSGNDFLWEEEAQLLLKNNQHSEAILLMQSLLEESQNNLFSTLYITEIFLNFTLDKVTLQTILSELEKLTKQEMDVEQKADMYYQQLLCLKKLKEDKKLDELKKVATKFYSDHTLDITNLNKI
ncbi:thioredoxin domain-containing protein [Flavobacterium lacus]|uniref:Thioredoxin n=1 Tax=Flavobacterium lacus TaxID=1353778 RepID=A0A328X0C1_9FLAO|nr:thioredoxin domain-containing protein [Flavobacterium lacus]RAR50846.1 thioredoxin [Flavobacterium lacus]